MPNISEEAWRAAAAVAVSAGQSSEYLSIPSPGFSPVLRRFRWQSLSIGKRDGGEN